MSYGSKAVNVMMNNPNRVTVYPIRSRMNVLYPEVTMLSVPLLRDNDRVFLHAEFVETGTGARVAASDFITVEYRHYAPKSMVYYGGITELMLHPIDLGKSSSLRGRVGALSLSAEIGHGEITSRIIWKSGSEILRTHEVILRGPGVAVIPEILTYE